MGVRPPHRGNPTRKETTRSAGRLFRDEIADAGAGTFAAAGAAQRDLLADAPELAGTVAILERAAAVCTFEVIPLLGLFRFDRAIP